VHEQFELVHSTEMSSRGNGAAGGKGAAENDDEVSEFRIPSNLRVGGKDYICGSIVYKEANDTIRRSLVMGEVKEVGGVVELHAIHPPATARRKKAVLDDAVPTESDDEDDDQADAGKISKAMQPRDVSPEPDASKSRAPSLAPVAKPRGRSKNQHRPGWELGKQRVEDEEQDLEGASGAAGGPRREHNSLRPRYMTPSYKENGFTDDDIVQQSVDDIKEWCNQKKHTFKNKADMLDVMRDKCFPKDTRKFYVDQSRIQGAGNSLFASVEIDPGEVVAFLGTDLLRPKMNNQMVRFCDGVPWNDLHPDYCMGGLVNSSAEKSGKENVGFFSVSVRCLSGVFKVVMVIALTTVKEKEELLLDYPIRLDKRVRYECTAEEEKDDVPSVTRDQYNRARSPSVGPGSEGPGSMQAVNRWIRQSVMQSANIQNAADNAAMDEA